MITLLRTQSIWPADPIEDQQRQELRSIRQAELRGRVYKTHPPKGWHPLAFPFLRLRKIQS